jgi:hypothetical protein
MASQVIAEKRRREPGAPDVSSSPTLVKTKGQVHQRGNCFRSVQGDLLLSHLSRAKNAHRRWGTRCSVETL